MIKVIADLVSDESLSTSWFTDSPCDEKTLLGLFYMGTNPIHEGSALII